MREPIREFVKIVAATLPIAEPIYEFGALQVSGQEEIADLRPIFRAKEYVGCDFQEGPGVDKVLDLHHIDLPDNSAGTVFCLETLEHVEYPHKALEEIHRILRPGGIILISSVMWHPIHDYPSDYWRFTPAAFEVLLGPFSRSYVTSLGEEAFPHAILGIGFKELDVPLESFERKMRYLALKWRQPDEEPWTYRKSWKCAVKLIVPPLLLSLGRRVKWLLQRQEDANG